MQNALKRLMLLMGFSILIGTGCSKKEEIVLHQHTTDLHSNVEVKSDARESYVYLVQSWYNLLMKLVIETPGCVPPVAARAFGYTGVTLYESLLDEMPHNHSLVGQLNGFTSLPQRMYGHSYAAHITANAAMAGIIKYLFQNASAENKNKIDSLESANEKLHPEQFSETIINRSRNYGRAIADAVFNWSLHDGGHQAYLNIFPAAYIAPIGVDKWIPTPPLYQHAMLPYWGNNRPMVPANNSGSIDPPPPPVFSPSPGSPFYDAAYEVYYTGLHLSAEQRKVALYWADGGGTFTPVGHNVAIALQMIRNHNLNLNEAAVLLAKVGIAENDAAIVCWRAKFKANLLRPVTYIQAYIDPSWMPLVNTPPFPSYTSGHSTFSAAAATILTFEIGNQISFTDSSKIYYGFSPRSFNNFYGAAQEAAISRLYGGIHYEFDNDNGYKCGQLIATNVLHLHWKS